MRLIIGAVVLGSGLVLGLALWAASARENHEFDVFTCYEGPQRVHENVMTTIPTDNGGKIVMQWRRGLKSCQ